MEEIKVVELEVLVILNEAHLEGLVDGKTVVQICEQLKDKYSLEIIRKAIYNLIINNHISAFDNAQRNVEYFEEKYTLGGIIRTKMTAKGIEHFTYESKSALGKIVHAIINPELFAGFVYALGGTLFGIAITLLINKCSAP